MRYLKPQKPQTNLMGIYLNPAVRLSTRQVDGEEGNNIYPCLVIL